MPAIVIRNLDWKNWTEALPVEDIDGAEDKRKPVTRPRPGHADLAGAIKYNFHDARYILERASARETAARVAVGALAKALLGEFGIAVLSHVIAVGPVKLERAAAWEELVGLSRRDDLVTGGAGQHIAVILQSFNPLRLIPQGDAGDLKKVSLFLDPS